ncbi:MAG: hypothetical protein FWE62_03890, partial [Firmicutes bacterium]|nr:hypothetical protein [Bacillota bacterium]
TLPLYNQKAARGETASIDYHIPSTLVNTFLMSFSLPFSRNSFGVFLENFLGKKSSTFFDFSQNFFNLPYKNA